MAKYSTYPTGTPVSGDQILFLDGSDTVTSGDADGSLKLADFADFASTGAAVSAQTGTTYTLALTDANDIVTMDNASANTLTVPANASVAFPVGTIISVIQIGAGATTITGATGVTINGVSAGSATLTAQHSAVSLAKIGADTWNLAGDHGGVA